MKHTPQRTGRPPLPPEERADSQIQLRVSRRRKSAYVRAASKTRQTLAAWCFAALDRESGYDPGARRCWR